MSTEFRASDRDVRDIAALFALKGWTWGGHSGDSSPYIPKAKDIAETLNRLADNAGTEGRSGTGRLWVSLDDGDLNFGIEWYGREP